ncbi:MAG: DoxX family protein [Candidatus Woesearchaeota archaeon]
MNIDEKLDSFKEYAPIVLRYALSLVFFWFAINQLIMPDDWTGYLPEFLANTANPVMFIYANAIFEIIFGTLLILGIFTRLSAFLLGIHLLGISATLGWSAVAIRDYGLAFATLSIVLSGPDKLCLRK